MKCNARCLELRLGDHCGRCGGIVDIKKPARPWNAPLSRAELLEVYNPGRSGDAHGEVTEHRSEDGAMVFRRLNRPVPVDGLEQRRRDFEAIPLSPSQRLMLEEANRRLPRYFVRADGELASMLRPERCCGMVDAHGGPGCTYCPMGTRPVGTGPRYTEEAIVELEDDLALANFQLAHDVVASMSEGPAPRAADDADGIQKAMREIHLAEGRRPISCAPGQHNFQFSAGTYTCTVCLRGKPEDGR